jgi:hypothetical protein
MATAESLARASRRRAVRRLALEALVILALTGGAIGAVYFLTVEPNASPWRLAARNVQDVSRSQGLQTEVAVAVDPSNPRIVVASSNDSLEPQVRVYTSTNGGRTWSSRIPPLFNAGSCAWGDPAVAVGPSGRQYVAFIQQTICSRGGDLTPYLVVAARDGPKGRWTMRRVAPPALPDGFDDKPAIAVDDEGRAYAAWSRLIKSKEQTTVVSWSDDGGRTWSAPRVVSGRLAQPQLVTLTTAGRTVYIAGVDARFGIWVGRSTDRARHFRVRRAAPLPGNRAATCAIFGGYPLPQQAVRCLGPDPTVAFANGRVFVTYAVNGPDETQDVRIAGLDSSLRILWRGRVGPPEKGKADQFWPTSSVDRRTGDLWACFYDTTGDSSRRNAWFSCTVSRDGRRWSTPARASPEAANAQVLWGTRESTATAIPAAGAATPA